MQYFYRLLLYSLLCLGYDTAIYSMIPELEDRVNKLVSSMNNGMHKLDCLPTGNHAIKLMEQLGKLEEYIPLIQPITTRNFVLEGVKGLEEAFIIAMTPPIASQVPYLRFSLVSQIIPHIGALKQCGKNRMLLKAADISLLAQQGHHHLRLRKQSMTPEQIHALMTEMKNYEDSVIHYLESIQITKSRMQSWRNSINIQ